MHQKLKAGACLLRKKFSYSISWGFLWLGLKNRFFCFHKNRFAIDQRSKFEKTKTLKMYFAVEILSTYLLTVKKSFKTHKLTLFFVRPQTTDKLLLLLGDIKGHIKKNVNRYFQEHQWIACFFMAKITQILLFLGMLVLERSNITVWEQHHFKNFFCYVSFMYVSTLQKRIFSAVPVKHFSL